MMSPARLKQSRSLRLYARLLELYPPSFLQRHRAEMLQNFADLEDAEPSKAALWLPDTKGPGDEPYFALFHLTAWQIRDRRLCRVDVALRDRVFLLRPDARPAGFACLRRLSARHAGHVHRDASLRNAAKQLVRGRVLVAWILLFTIGYFRYGGTPGHPALQVFGGFLLGMLSMSIAIRFYGMP
jgi:hypothetical protein